jgi:hypothetical protein
MKKGESKTRRSEVIPMAIAPRLSDKEWYAFKKWWKSKWMDGPHRESIEEYLKWKQKECEPNGNKH